MQPLIVKSQARSGSTYLMQCLSGLDGIAVAKHWPFEIRYAQYLSAAFHTLTAEADREQSSRPNFFHRDFGDGWIGKNPFNLPLRHGYHRFFGDAHRERWRAFLQSEVEGFYASVAEANGVSAKHFAEKAPYVNFRNMVQSPNVIHQLYAPPVRTVYLVRDPRDIFCSNRAFFHADKSPSPEQLKNAITGLSRLMSLMAEHYREATNETQQLVRYEDLIRSPEQTLHRITSWLGLAPSDASIQAAVAQPSPDAHRSHITAASPEASIGRWQTDLPADLAAHATQAFEPYLTAFGYAA